MHADHGAVACADKGSCPGQAEVVESGKKRLSLVGRVDWAVEASVGTEPINRQQAAGTEDIRLGLPPTVCLVACVSDNVAACGDSASDKK
jgi:hypothetical protein